MKSLGFVLLLGFISLGAIGGCSDNDGGAPEPASGCSTTAECVEVLLSTGSCAGCNLRGANLIGADLSGADLREANLIEADLSEADLREADLREANLSGALWCQSRILSHKPCICATPSFGECVGCGFDICDGPMKWLCNITFCRISR